MIVAGSVVMVGVGRSMLNTDLLPFLRVLDPVQRGHKNSAGHKRDEKNQGAMAKARVHQSQTLKS